MKNIELIADNIQEAKDELEDILSEINKNNDYSDVELKIALEHAYHHLNYAWNIRNVKTEKLLECSKEDFIEWSKYPKDEIMEYE